MLAVCASLCALVSFNGITSLAHRSLTSPRSTVRRAMRLTSGEVELERHDLSLTLEQGALKIARGESDSAQLPIIDGVPPSVTSEAGAAGGLFLHVNAGSHQAEHSVSLGALRCKRFLAAARVTRYWMGPAWGRAACDVPHDTQFLLLELAPDEHVLLLPLLDEQGLRATLHGAGGPGTAGRGTAASAGGRNELWLHAESGDERVGASSLRALYVAAGAEPFALLRRGFAEVAAATGSFAPRSSKVLPP